MRHVTDLMAEFRGDARQDRVVAAGARHKIMRAGRSGPERQSRKQRQRETEADGTDHARYSESGGTGGAL
jgi:hypothetical protein